MSDVVTQVIPPRSVEHVKISRPTGVGISQAPNGTTTITHSGFVDECQACRVSWPCFPSRLAALESALVAAQARAATLEAENAALRSGLEKYGGHIETACCDVDWDAPCVCGLDALLASEPGQYGAAVLEAAEALSQALLTCRFPAGDTPEQVEAQAKAAHLTWDRALRRRMAGED